MSRRFVDYDRIAETYDQRYSLNRLDGVAKALEERLSKTEAETILDVGCGTGRWLSELAPRANLAVGLDRSLGMLLRVPVEDGRGRWFVGRVSRSLLLTRRSTSSPVSMRSTTWRPRPRSSWMLSDFSDPGVHWQSWDWILTRTGIAGICTTIFLKLELDLRRYPSTEQLREWMRASDLENIETVAVERIQRRFVGGEILGDYFLQRKASSQLAILSDEAWSQGLHRIRRAIQKGEQEGAPAIFEVDLALVLVYGSKPVATS